MESYQIVEGIGLYFVTFPIVEWLPVFLTEAPCKILTNSLNFCVKNKYLRVNAYVIMPTHLHAILFDRDFNPDRLKSTLTDMRKFTGRQLADYCGQHMPAFYTEEFRKHSGNDRQRRFWQRTKHPIGIFSEKFWQQKMDYIHWNPSKAGLVRNPEDWRFSSAAYWLVDNTYDTNVVLSHIDW